MATQLRWNNIDAPNLSSALAGVSNQGRELREAFKGIGDMFSGLTKAEREKQTNSLLTQVAMAQDLGGLSAVRGGLDPNNRMIDARQAAAAINQREQDIRGNMRWQFDWDTDTAQRDNAMNDLAARQHAMNTGSLDKVVQHAGTWKQNDNFYSALGDYRTQQNSDRDFAEKQREARAREADAAARLALARRAQDQADAEKARQRALFQAVRDRLPAELTTSTVGEASTVLQNALLRSGLIQDASDLAAVGSMASTLGTAIATPNNSQSVAAELRGTAAQLEAARNTAKLGEEGAVADYLAANPQIQAYRGMEKYQNMDNASMDKALAADLNINEAQARAMLRRAEEANKGTPRALLAASMVQSQSVPTIGSNIHAAVSAPARWAAGLADRALDTNISESGILNTSRVDRDLAQSTTAAAQQINTGGQQAFIDQQLDAQRAPYIAALAEAERNAQLAAQNAALNNTTAARGYSDQILQTREAVENARQLQILDTQLSQRRYKNDSERRTLEARRDYLRTLMGM